MNDESADSETCVTTLESRVVEREPLPARAVASGVAAYVPRDSEASISGTELVNGRFRVLSCIGRGGMGSVYEAFDCARQAPVALKLLRLHDSASLYGLKNEFRALAHLSHPNLVRLHELFSDGGQWFFSMDLVPGEPFDRWVRPENRHDAQRLRSALAQLVDAVNMLHAAGKLHRDLKPSNVLVTPEGRVVLLDFGLVVESRQGGTGQTVEDERIAGTPAYMAPEQAASLPATEASDFYAIGVMLFEALCGRWPFEGPVSRMLFEKQQRAAPAVVAAGETLPADLVELCSQLLATDPARRPAAEAIATLLASGTESGVRARSLRASMIPKRVLGRDAELAVLRSAYTATLRGSAQVVMVSGESGIGKTALCTAFLADLQAEGRAVVLAGRCHERESIPFKGLDALVDELSRYLRRVPNDQLAALLPRDVAALSRLFPVLGRIDAIALAPVAHTHDPRELRRRALGAFVELLGRIRDRYPLVIYLDDAHWIDLDSLAFVREAFAHRVRIPALFVTATQSLAADREVALEQAIEFARNPSESELVKLELGPLSAAAIGSLVASQRRSAPAASGADCDWIVQECGGNPFIAVELARYAGDCEQGRPASLSLRELLVGRAATLSVSAARLLDCIALAGQPLAADAALAAVSATHAALDELVAANLVHAKPSIDDPGHKLVECYHDRIRGCIREGLDPAQCRQLFERLAQTLSERGGADPELLVRCFDGAGDPARAFRWAAIAAERAAASLAFDHAATLYGKALAILDAAGSPATAGDERFQVLCQRAEALENAGRGFDAAAAYEQAAAACEQPTECAQPVAATEPAGAASRVAIKLDLRRRAAQQLLLTGYTNEGAALAEQVCREVGLEFPDPSLAPVAAVSFRELRPKLRALRGEPRPRRAVSELELLRLRIADSVVIGLNRWRPLHAASLASRYLALALEADDPLYLVRALGLNSFAYAARMRSNRVRSMRFQAAMVAIAHTDGRPELVGFSQLIQGVASYHQQDFAKARRYFAEARRCLRQCAGVSWEHEAIELHDQMSAYTLGHYADIARCTPQLVEDALLRGRHFAAAMLSGMCGMPAWLAQDAAAAYRFQLTRVRAYWHEQNPPAWPDYFLLIGEALLCVYEGDPAAGFELIAARGQAYGRATVTTASSMASIRYAACFAACAASSLARVRGPAAAKRSDWLEALDASIGALEREGSLYARGTLELLRSARAHAADDIEACVANLKRALPILDEAELGMHAAAARRRLGQLLGGTEGSAFLTEGTEAMQRQEIKNLEAMTEVLAPGCSA